MLTIKNLFTFLILAITSVSCLFAQAPANDDCSGAISVPVKSTQASCAPTTVNKVNTVNATSAAYTSNCWNVSYDDDMWYSFNATDTVIL